MMLLFLGLFLGYIGGVSTDYFRMKREYRRGFKNGVDVATNQAAKAVRDLRIYASECQLMETREAFRKTLYVDIICDIVEEKK